MRTPMALVSVVLAVAALAAGAKTRAPVIIPVPERSSHASISSPCQRAWYQAVDGGVALSYYKASPYITNMKLADPDHDGVFTKSEFVEALQTRARADNCDHQSASDDGDGVHGTAFGLHRMAQQGTGAASAGALSRTLNREYGFNSSEHFPHQLFVRLAVEVGVPS